MKNMDIGSRVIMINDKKEFCNEMNMISKREIMFSNIFKGEYNLRNMTFLPFFISVIYALYDICIFEF